MITPFKKDKFQSYMNENNNSSDTWMISLADLLSLLIVFFLLIYSMSTVKSGDWKNMKESIDTKFSMNRIIENKFSTIPLGIDKLDSIIGSDLGYLYTILSTKIKIESPLGKNISIKSSGKEIVITMDSDETFLAETALLADDAETLLFEIGEILQNANNKIDLVNFIYKPSTNNNEKSVALSLNRSMLVVKAFKEFGNNSDFGLSSKFTNNSDNEGKIKIIIHDFVS